MIPLYRPTIRRADMDAVLRRLAGDAIGTGEFARDLARSVAKFLGQRDGVALRSVRSALLSAFHVLQLGRGARIGLSALAPASGFAAIAQMGCEPVVLDVGPDRPILDSPLNADYQVHRIDALIVDTRLGYVPDLESFRELSMPIVELVSEGYGGYIGDRLAGSFGECTVVGLEPEHILTSGGGAVCVVGKKRHYDSLRALCTTDDDALPDMNAALGLAQLGELPRFIEKRRETLARYHRSLARTRNRTFLQAEDGECVHSAFPVRIAASPVDVQKYSDQHGVRTGRLGTGTALDVVRSDASRNQEVFSGTVTNAISLAGSTVVFPLYPAMRGDEIKRVERVLGTLP